MKIQTQNQSSDRCETGRDLLEVKHLATQDQRRTVSVAGHHQWRESIATARPFDEVDEFVEELRAGEFEEKGSRP